VPNWAEWGGRPAPYAIEWVATGSGNYYYTKTDVTVHSPDSAITMWLRVTDSIPYRDERGVFSIPQVGSSPPDVLSVQVEGETLGNILTVQFFGTAIGASFAYIQNAWQNLTIVFTGGTVEMWVNGALHGTAVASYSGNIAGYTLGVTNPAGTLNYLDNCIVDEIAFFNQPVNPIDIYNNGVPIEYEMDYEFLISSHEVEKATGSIRAQAIPARYYQVGTSPAAFNWQGLGGNLNGIVEITTDTLKSSDTNALSRMADRYGQYGKGVANIAWDNRTPIGAGNNLEDKANGLMPYPAGGGFSTVGGTNPLIGQMEEPEMTPKVSKAITAGSNGDSTAYANQGGTDSLSGVTDARPARLFAPLFVKKP